LTNNKTYSPDTTYDEKELLLKIAEGDEKAFERLFLIHKDKVYELAKMYTESVVSSEELVQDIFIKVWTSRIQLPHINDFRAWLFTLTRNRSFNVLRDTTRAGIRERDMINYIPQNVSHAEEKAISADTQKLIDQALNLLSPPQRQAFDLLKLQELSREEAARKMGISPNTIKVHLLNAMRIVRGYLLSKDVLLILFFIRP
jgi:RNA polymerase sigma factor (sigma-70 family)